MQDTELQAAIDASHEVKIGPDKRFTSACGFLFADKKFSRFPEDKCLFDKSLHLKKSDFSCF